MNTRLEKNKKIQKEIIKEEQQKKIRKIVKFVSIILLILFSILFYGMFIGAKYTEINEIKLTYNELPSNFHGIKIVHFTDLLYNSLNKNDLNNIKNKINKLEADIIIFTGGIKRNNYTLNNDDLILLEDFFKGLNANLIKYFVNGNNDNETYKVIMENSNFVDLNNKQVLLYYNDITPIQILGLNKNIKDLEINQDYFNICLLHNPDLINKFNNNCDIAFAGDNLGGEIKIPFIGGIYNHNKYVDNYYKINDTDLYISNGLGNNHNIRLFNHPSINFYRLVNY